VTRLIHLIQSSDPRTGGVIEAVNRLNDEFLKRNFDSKVICEKRYQIYKNDIIFSHGLWQWPGSKAWQNYNLQGNPYLIFPHGMLDPWFKKNYLIKHLKKQLYWFWRQSKIMKDAHAVCFTTDEERNLAQKTFTPYKCNEYVTGLGVTNPSNESKLEISSFLSSFPKLKDKRILLYLGRFHPKKGVDLLIKSFLKESNKDDVLLLAGPLDHRDNFISYLQTLTHNKTQIVWSGMLKGNLKWGALRIADSLILPSHQENFGMVIAEALSVGTPVFLTNKVNLWREVIDSNAGFVANDDMDGISDLLIKWISKEHLHCIDNAERCFREKLHISHTVEKIISILPST
jgi:glycosyltransferase involved in cell wall biosynthesis